ncbi:hypothetical protein BS78_03G116600 [Paspalum vaginatum]|nr:hypothetical protein BS78_03G116600 [Paspalum vaginatum]
MATTSSSGIAQTLFWTGVDGGTKLRDPLPWFSKSGDLIDTTCQVQGPRVHFTHWRKPLSYAMPWRMDFGGWTCGFRSGRPTADPRNTLDPRFRPRHWVMLQDQIGYGVVGRLMVNTATGRFLRKEIPVLDGYCIVCCTADGLLVLADWALPYASCVLNPLTGYMVRFAAPMDHGQECDRRRCLCRRYKKYTYPLVRKAVVGCIAVDGWEDDGTPLPLVPASVANKITELMTPHAAADHNNDTASPNHCFLVESAGEMLAIFKLENRMEVFKMDRDGTALEPIESIGNRTIFLCCCFRCLSLDADKIPSIEPDCVYFVENTASESVQMYDLKADRQVQSATAAAATPSAHLPAFLSDSDTAASRISFPITICSAALHPHFSLAALSATGQLDRAAG